MKRTKLTQQVLLALLIGSTFWSGTASAETRTITGEQTADVTLPGSGNTLIIESGTEASRTTDFTKIAAGYWSGTSGTVSGNTMTINGGTLSCDCDGGYAAGSYNTVSGNTITVNGGTLHAIYGGHATGSNNTVSGNTVSGNTVIINDVDQSGDIYGGQVDIGSSNTVSGNTVIINGGHKVAAVYGGYAMNATVAGNTVIINSYLYSGGPICGGCVSGGLVTGNTVIINASANRNVYGGLVEMRDGNTERNTVVLNSGSVALIYGGNVIDKDGKADENTVIMNGGEAREVYGGYVAHGSSSTASAADGNTVIMNGGLIKETLSGGYMLLSGDANNNTVILNGGSLGTGNTSMYIYGGCAGAYGPGAGIYSGDANGNTVILNGGSVAMYTHLCGGHTCQNSTAGDANNNTVTLKSGTFAGESITAGESYKGTANGNVVNVYAGVCSQDVWLIAAGVAHADDACNNTMNLYGSIYLPDCELLGGQSETSHTSSGNTLNVYGQATVAMINYFQNYSFYIPATLTGSTSLLTLTSTNFSYFSTDATVSSVSLAGDSAYTSGDTITLLSGDLFPTKSSLSTHSLTVQKGIAASYPATLNLNLTQFGPGSSLTMTLGEGTLNPKVKSLSEAQSAVLANLNTGADLAAGRGMENALAAAAGGNGQAVGFVGTSAGQETISTGSEVDGRSFGVMIGAAGQHRIPAGQLTTGVFAEIGRGSFNTRNEVSGATVNADGHSNYKGGGILARLDRTNGSWYEGSLHTGHMDSTYNSADVTDYLGNGTSYDVGSPYCSAHIGLGHVWRLGQKEQLDIYGKYFWSHVPSRSVTVSSGDVFDFAGATSNRLRLGMRWTKHCDDSSVYAGLAVERELSGSQRATVAGFDVPAPSLRGTTGIAELGWRVPQTAGNPFGVDLNLTGLFGKRQGVTGGVSFIWGW